MTGSEGQRANRIKGFEKKLQGDQQLVGDCYVENRMDVEVEDLNVNMRRAHSIRLA